ncbi:urease accessory protein [Halopseudomonas xinjiangensis]|uniref:Urease accessory protein n=1 Tax=Halopseudomonas xinjiangensis TaxID=487184 RepID=A0A1H1REY0_9GAMM|nr:HupE/UreJ family protein [Halopseudomonas xinjiangensis]SDS34250.1 urease accessory protein [Halopseudomonas xinjiangensis]
MNNVLSRSIVLAVLLGAPALAQAHSGHGDLGGLASGLAHPFAGLDHLLAMLAVGLWGAQLGGRARWALPLLFVVFMLIGAGAGLAGVAIPGVEQGIVASVMALGMLLLWARRVALLPGAVLVSTFAVVHGVAHGTEMPVDAGMLGYMLGFALSTAVLHLAGAGLGSRRTAGLARLIGAGIALAGVGLALG